MKISSFFKPVTRQWTKLTSQTRANSSATSVSRTSSASSTSTPKRMSSIGSMTSEDSFSSHFAAHRDDALRTAYARALQSGAADPLRVAKTSALNAVAAERNRVMGLAADVRTAEHNHNKAKLTMATISLRLHQAERIYGKNSPQAVFFSSQKKAAAQKIGQASAELYLAKIAF